MIIWIVCVVVIVPIIVIIICICVRKFRKKKGLANEIKEGNKDVIEDETPN